MTDFEVTIERFGYNAGSHTYWVVKRFGAESIGAAIEALKSHERHGLTYPDAGELRVHVKEVPDAYGDAA